MALKVVAKKSEYMNGRIAPSCHLILLVVKKYHKNRLAVRENITKSENTTIFTFNGENVNVRPMRMLVAFNYMGKVAWNRMYIIISMIPPIGETPPFIK